MSLTFLHAGLAVAGVAAALAPVIIHLLLRQQPRQLDFPALRLIRDRKKRSVQRMRLRQILLMLLRMAILMLLGLALARPTFKSDLFSVDQDAPVSAVLLIDTSPSMELLDQNEPRLEVAKEVARGVIEDFPDGSEITVIESTNPGANVPLDIPGAMARVDVVETQTKPTTLNDGLRVAFKTLGNAKHERKEVFVVTDLAANAWATNDGGRLKNLAELVETGVRIFVVDVGVDEPDNLTLAPIELDQARLGAGELSLSITVENLGDAVDRNILLTLDGEARDSRPVHLPGGEATKLDFRVPGVGEGYHQGTVSIQPGDALEVDNTRFFTFRVRPKASVLVVADNDAESLHWRKALVPDELRRRGEGRFDLRKIRAKNLGDQTFAGVEVVCLLGVTTLSDEEWLKVSDFVQGGGGLFVALGEGLDPNSYNSDAAKSVLAGQLEQEVDLKKAVVVDLDDFSPSHLREVPLVERK